MTGVGGLGPWPGTEPLEAQTSVLGDLTDLRDGLDGLPWSVRLPQRGPGDALVAADGLALLLDLPAELGPHGWRLADRPGRDALRLAAARAERVDVLAVAAHAWTGSLVLPVCGPLSLSAAVYLARGDRALADEGAVEEITASLVAGVAEHLAAVRRSVPGARPTVLLHEPVLAAVVAGALPTFSGYARLRAVPGAAAAERLSRVVDGLRAAGAERVALHVGSGGDVLPVARAARPDAVGVEVATLDERRWERVAETVEQGPALWAQVPRPATSQCAGPDIRGVAESVLTGWSRVGLERSRLRDVVLLAPAVGDGGAVARGAGGAGDGAREARDVLASVVRATSLVAERAEE